MYATEHLKMIEKILHNKGVENFSLWNTGGNVYCISFEDKDRRLVLDFGYASGRMGWGITTKEGNPLKGSPKKGETWGEIDPDIESGEKTLHEYTPEEEANYIIEIAEEKGFLRVKYNFEIEITSREIWSSIKIIFLKSFIEEELENLLRNKNNKVKVR